MHVWVEHGNQVGFVNIKYLKTNIDLKDYFCL